MRLGIGLGVLRDDLDALAVVEDRRGLLRQVAEDAAMALRRPGVVQRPFDLDPLHRQPRPLVLVRPDLVDRSARPASPSGRMRIVVPRLQVLDELDRRSACRRARRSSRPGGSSSAISIGPAVDAEGDRLAGALDSRRRRCGSGSWPRSGG